MQAIASAIAKTGRIRLSGVRNKSITPERNEKARQFVQRLVDGQYNGNVTNAAKAIGVSQSLLYEFLNGTRGAGMKLLEGIADLTETSVDQIVGRSGPSGARRLRDVAGYDQIASRLKQRVGHRYSESAFESAGNTTGGALPAVLDEATVLRFVQFWYDVETSMADQIEAERNEVDALIEADQRQEKAAPRLPVPTRKR